MALRITTWPQGATSHTSWRNSRRTDNNKIPSSTWQVDEREGLTSGNGTAYEEVTSFGPYLLLNYFTDAQFRPAMSQVCIMHILRSKSEERTHRALRNDAGIRAIDRSGDLGK